MKFIVIIFLNFFPSSFIYANWPSFMANEERNGYIDSTILPPLTEQWLAQVPGQIIASPVIYKDKVIVATRFGYIIALDIKTGNWLWDYSTGGFNDATPTTSSSTLIAPSMDSYVYAFNMEVDSGTSNADLKWQTYLGSTLLSSPLVYKNKVYIGSSFPENSVYILDFKTGAIIKKAQFEKPINSPITLCGNRIVFGGNDGRIYSMDLDGNNIFSYQTPGGSFNMKAISCKNGRLYSLPGYDERSLYVNSSTDTALIFKSAPLSVNSGYSWDWQDSSSVAISSNTLYFVAGNQNTSFFGLNLGDEYLPSFSSFTVGSVSEFKISASPSVAQNAIFLNANSGKFYVISSTGGILSEFNLGYPSYSSVALSDGWAIVASYDGVIRGYKANKYLFFSSPSYGDIINSIYEVKLTANDVSANSYILDYSAYPLNDFILISSGNISASNLENYPIYHWNTQNVANGDYTLRIRLLADSVLSSQSSIKIRVNAKPNPPSNLVAMDNPDDKCNKIILTWNASATPAVVYQIYRSSYQIENWELIASTSSLSYLDNNAICGSTYSYKLTAYDEYLESDFSNMSSAYSMDNSAKDSVPPSKVNDLSAVKGVNGGSAILKWTEVGDDGNVGRAYYYEIRYSTSLPFIWENSILKSSSTVMANPGDIESVIVEGLLSDLTYYFGVKVYDYSGNQSEVSNIVSINPQYDDKPPHPPTNFFAFDTPGDRGGRITLAWDLSADDGNGDNDVYGYKIFRSTNTTFDYSSPYIILPKGSRGYIDNTAVNGVKYFYIVGAYDSSNISFSSAAWAIASDNYVYVSIKSGANLTLPNGAKFYVPPGSLNQDDYLLFTKIDSSEAFKLFELDNLKIAYNLKFKPSDIIYELKADNPNTAFISNAKIIIPYKDEEISGLNKENLRVYYLDNNSWKLIRKFEIDKEKNTILAEVNKLGKYGLFEYIPEGDLFDDNFVYTYPNPARGENLTFKFSVNYDSVVDIRIYDIAGGIIDKLKSSCSGGAICEVKWNIKNIASGVYIYVFEANGGGKSKKTEKKLAIIK